MDATGDEYALLFCMSLEGSKLVRIRADEQVTPELTDDWPAPRAFIYAFSVLIVTERHGWSLYGDETYGDLKLSLIRPRVSDPPPPDWLERREIEGEERLIRRVSFGRHEESGTLESVAVELDDGSVYVMFTGELDEDADGTPRLRQGDEMLFLFPSLDEAARAGLLHKPTVLAGRVTASMRSWLEDPPAEPSTLAPWVDVGTRSEERSLPWFELRAPVFRETSTVSLGCKLLCLDDFHGGPQDRPLEDRRPRRVEAGDRGGAAKPPALRGVSWFEEQRAAASAPASITRQTNLELVATTHEEITQDFEDAPETTKSGLYSTVYEAEYGSSRGTPYAALSYGHALGLDDARLLRELADVSLRAQALLAVTLGPALWDARDAEGISPRIARHGIKALPEAFQQILVEAPHVVPCAPVEEGPVSAPLFVADSIARSFERTGLCYPISEGTAATVMSRAFAEGGICSVERSGDAGRLVGVPGGLPVRAVAMQLLRATMLACRGGWFATRSPEQMQSHVQSWLDQLAVGAEPLLQSATCTIALREIPQERQMLSWVTIGLDIVVARWPEASMSVLGVIDTE